VLRSVTYCCFSHLIGEQQRFSCAASPAHHSAQIAERLIQLKFTHCTYTVAYVKNDGENNRGICGNTIHIYIYICNTYKVRKLQRKFDALVVQLQDMSGQTRLNFLNYLKI
jgi:hypothetical protein